MRAAPPACRRIVGAALRRYRENLGRTLDDAATFLECDRSKISRIETGERGIRVKELRELLTEYGIDDEQQAVLAAIADPRGARRRYGTYVDAAPGAWQDYLLLETAASQIMIYEAQRIPALLQTPEYAQALAAADPDLADEESRDKAVEATLARQRAIMGEREPDIRLIVGEAALRQEVGGEVVMEGQLRLLAGVSSDSGTITLQVLPFRSGAHAAAAVGSLAILRFAEALELGVVHLGGAGGGVCLEGQVDLAAYARVFEELRVSALSPAQSALMLQELTIA
jgi:transcriptional regulator with XRE-family HTH domain